jgi:hypothetical protein
MLHVEVPCDVGQLLFDVDLDSRTLHNRIVHVFDYVQQHAACGYHR